MRRHLVAVHGHVPVGQQQRAAWAGKMPASNNDTDCATVRGRYRGPRERRRDRADAAADPVGDAWLDVHQDVEHDAARLSRAASRRWPPDEPGGHQLRHRLQGQPRVPGALERLPRDRHLRSGEPDPDLQHRGVPPHVGPGRRRRARQHPRPHVGFAVDRPRTATTCMGQATGTGFEGIHIWDISDPANPVYKKQLRMASTGNDVGAPSSAAARTPRPACRMTRAATSTCTSVARAAPATASTSSASSSPTRPTRSSCAGSRTAATASRATTTTCSWASAAPRSATRCARAAMASRRTSSTWRSRPTRPARRRAPAASRTRRCCGRSRWA